MRMHLKFRILFACLFLPAFLFAQNVPKELKPYIKSIDISEIGGKEAVFGIQQISSTLYKCEGVWSIHSDVKQDDVSIKIRPAFNPNFHWAPHLTPTNDHIIAQHVFRSPALIAKNDEYSITLVPGLNELMQKDQLPMYLDLNALENELTIGYSKSKVEEHVLFKRDTGLLLKEGVWTGTSREPLIYKGVRKERVFENAFLSNMRLTSHFPTSLHIYIADSTFSTS